MSQNSNHSSHRSNSLSSTMPWLYDTSSSEWTPSSHGPHGTPAIHFQREIVLGLPADLLGTVDYPIEISTDVETDPSMAQESQDSPLGIIPIDLQDYLTYSDQVEDVTAQMRQTGAIVDDPIEVSSDSDQETPVIEAAPIYRSLSAYLYQLPPTPSAGDGEPFQAVFQGTRTVYDYFKEFLNSPLADLCVQRGDNELMVAFYRGLRPELRFAMGTRDYSSLAEMYNHARTLELELGNERTIRRYNRSLGTRRSNLKGPRTARKRTGNWNERRSTMAVSPPPGFGDESKGSNESDGSGGCGEDED